MTNASRSVLAFNLSYFFDQKAMLQEIMEQLLEWLRQGRIAPPPITTFPFEAVAEAHRAIESGDSVGKLILTMEHHASAT